MSYPAHWQFQRNWPRQDPAIYQERAKNITEKGYGRFPNNYAVKPEAGIEAAS